MVPGLHLWVFRDVTARKAAERSLSDAEARFRGMIENGAEGIWLVDQDGIILYGTPASARMLWVRLATAGVGTGPHSMTRPPMAQMPEASAVSNR